MHRLSEKLLAVFLILLLGLSPLQNALAGIAASSDQRENALQIECMHDGEMVMVADQSTHDCDQCNTEHGCTSHTCSSGHCTSCVLAVLSAFAYPASHTVITKMLSVEDSVVTKLSASLFRPPRGGLPCS